MKIDSPAELRSILLQYMTLLVEGKVSVSQANAAANISSEFHKSLREDFERAVQIVENPSLAAAESNFVGSKYTLQAVS